MLRSPIGKKRGRPAKVPTGENSVSGINRQNPLVPLKILARNREVNSGEWSPSPVRRSRSTPVKISFLREPILTRSKRANTSEIQITMENQGQSVMNSTTQEDAQTGSNVPLVNNNRNLLDSSQFTSDDAIILDPRRESISSGSNAQAPPNVENLANPLQNEQFWRNDYARLNLPQELEALRQQTALLRETLQLLKNAQIHATPLRPVE